ncbi:wings apart-like protein regulation of heterochromatin-domain-containing protein [Daldinia caldariorum]|uniref:wings apart-like protein regulation of heterochromatin-domain-containing protein n=1 Tax=Daldinia caldariorum TaxID=326644 RepID=UPI002007C52D|nr:wings apart-like protein regulation of heterochromatin-domain-containing protein [Daldinia caldariorum]KAI1468494.1 wings apart-like protein regulation of heterochromatin-domain-containing protein [Daldinia caldariorum]
MSTRQDFGAPRKKGLTTYGKAVRKRQSKPLVTPSDFPPIPEDDSVPKHKATVTRRRPTLLSSPLRDPSSPTSRGLDASIDIKPKQNSSRDNTQISDRKRKISQVYASKGRAQESYQTGQRDVSPDHVRRRPHPYTSISTSAGPRQTVLPTSRQRQRTRPTPLEPMDTDTAEPKLSSPPPTPTLPKGSRPAKTTIVRASSGSTSDATMMGKVKQDIVQQRIPLRFARENIPKPKVPSLLSDRADNEAQSTPQSVPDSGAKKRRKRIIDTLVEQRKDDKGETVEETLESQEESSQLTLNRQISDVSMADSQSLPQTPNRKPAATQATSTRTFTRSSSALKFTYGQGRKVLEEEVDLLESLALPEMSVPLKGRRLELGTPKKPANTKRVLDDDEDGLSNSPNSKLRDIHELRQAGENSRVADTMQDLVDQIGSPSDKPSSSRRAALLQIAEKIKDKTFMRQCRDHGIEAALLKDLGTETDVISGYLILSSLVTILAKWPSSHTQQLVRLGKPANLLALLLGVTRDIKVIARDRKSNLSKRSQTSLIAIQTMLYELPIWGEARPSLISPRSLALKCLHLLITQNINAAKDPSIFSPAVMEVLFTVLSEAVESAEHWDYPAAAEAIDLANTLSILDFYAVSFDESHRSNADWTTRYLPIVADVFSASSRNAVPDAPAQESGSKPLEKAILKLTINLTNNSLEAPEIFVSKGLIPALANSISSNFTRIWASLSEDAWVDGILDSLVLRLGILINFSENSPLVRQVIDDCHHDNQRPVDELIRLFLENYRRTAEADSMETSHLNVAFGYLSVLLGYLALHPPVRQKIRSSHSAKSITPLLDSLREFITHYKKVEQSGGEEDDGPQDHSSYMERLQDLVRQLEDQAIYD